MLHLSEGTLHAYLDGALIGDTGDAPELQNVERHLGVCGECRARLEDARLLREDVAGILAKAGPADVTRPPFEVLQARVNSQDDGGAGRDHKAAAVQHRRLHQMKSLAWAAAIVLAVAVGWIARSTILPARQDRYASEGEASGRIVIPVPDMETTNADTTHDRDQSQAQDAVQKELPTVSQIDETPTARTVPELGGVLAPAAEREEPSVTQQAAVTTGAGAEGRRAQPQVQDVARMRQQVVAEAAPGAPTVTRTVAANLAEAGLIWQVVDEATAAAILEAPVPAIDGFPIVAYASSVLNGRQAVRVQQSLESGLVLELVITVGAETGEGGSAKKGVELPDAPAGVLEEPINSVVVQLGNLHIRLSAALAADSLRTLSDLVRPGR